MSIRKKGVLLSLTRTKEKKRGEGPWPEKEKKKRGDIKSSLFIKRRKYRKVQAESSFTREERGKKKEPRWRKKKRVIYSTNKGETEKGTYYLKEAAKL